VESGSADRGGPGGSKGESAKRNTGEEEGRGEEERRRRTRRILRTGMRKTRRSRRARTRTKKRARRRPLAVSTTRTISRAISAGKNWAKDDYKKADHIFFRVPLL
jgi:hypothetical protein